MQCLKCGSDIHRERSIAVDNRIIRVHECPKCKRKYASEEIFHPISSDKGKSLKSEMHTLIYGQAKKRAIRKIKQKRQVAPLPKSTEPEVVYLTYGDLWERFKRWSRWNTELIFTDYRPYTLLDYSIITWDSEDTERAYQYDPAKDTFTVIAGAMTYEELLNRKRRA